jgi:protein gp37
MHPDWVRSLRDQCQAAGVAFFFKQWGGWVPDEAGCGGSYHFNSRHICLNLAGEQFDGWMESHGKQIAVMAKASKKAAGRLLDGREWNEYPEMA